MEQIYTLILNLNYIKKSELNKMYLKHSEWGTITGSVNTDSYLLNFLNMEDISKLSAICKNINQENLVIQLKQFRKTNEKRYIQLTLVNWAASNGCIEMLEWLKNNYTFHHIRELYGYKDSYNSTDMENRIGWYIHKVSMLKEWNEHDLIMFFDSIKYPTLIYTDVAIDRACANGHISTLEWFKVNFQYYFGYSKNSINSAATYGYTNILDWFNFNLQYELKYDQEAINGAASMGNIKSLEWFEEHKLQYPFKYSERAIDGASAFSQVKVLVWFHVRPQYEFKYTNKSIDNLPFNGKTDTLDWYLAHPQYPLKYTKEVFNVSINLGRDDILEWFKSHNFEIEYDLRVFDYAIEGGHVKILEWLKKHPELPFDYSEKALLVASRSNHTSIFDWFKANPEIPFKYSSWAIVRNVKYYWICLKDLFELIRNGR